MAEWAWERTAFGDGWLRVPRDEPYSSSTAGPCSSLSIFLFISLSTYLSIYLSISLSFYLSIYLSIFLSTPPTAPPGCVSS